MTKDEALKLALEALEESHPEAYRHTITAIKEALAQPEQEPVAWMYTRHWKGSEWFITRHQSELMTYKAEKVWPLYTTPLQRKPLSDEEIVLIVAECASSHQHTDIHFARAIEAAHGIKENT